MAYRKQWYTFGIKTNDDILSMQESTFNNGDTYFSVDYEKPMYLNDMNLIAEQTGCGKIWLNEDMIFGFVAGAYPLEVGEVTAISASSLFSPNAISIPLIPATSTSYTDFVGVIAMVPNSEISENPQGRGVAIQGMYNVRFTDATTYVQQGNLAILSSTPGQATQTGSTTTTGVIGAIMESKTLGVDKRALVMIQAFSSK